MQVIEITGRDVDVLRSELRSALAGDFGAITRVTATVTDNGKLQLAVNGYTGSAVGETNGQLAGQADDCPVVGGQVRHDPALHPYANIDAAEGDSEADAKPLKNKDRIALLEHDVEWLKGVVARAEQKLGVSLKS